MLAVLLAFVSIPSGAPCDTQVQASAREVHSIRARLFTIPEDDREDAAPGVPPKIANQGIPDLRVALAATAQVYFSCTPNPLTANDAQQALARLLNANRPDSETLAPDGAPKHTFGDALKVKVKTLSDDHSLLGVDLSYSIQCGDDHVFTVFKHNGGGWHRQVAYWNRDPAQALPTGAFGDVFLYGSVPGPGGQHLIAIAHGHPWCTSRFSGFSLDLIQPSSDSQPQRVLAHREYGYNRGDIPARLSSDPSGFTIHLGVPSTDLNVYEYDGVYRFVTTGGKLDRIAAASNARDFFEQWRDEDWQVASRWSDTANPTVKQTWDRLKFLPKKHEKVMQIEFGEVRACSDSNNFQIQMNSGTFFAFVRQNDGTFTMLGLRVTQMPIATDP